MLMFSDVIRFQSGGEKQSLTSSPIAFFPDFYTQVNVSASPIPVSQNVNKK